MPAVAPETSSPIQTARRTPKPAYRAAPSDRPVTFSRNPAKVRFMKTQPATTATSAKRTLALARVPSMIVGKRAAGASGSDCGKLKPAGSRQGPKISQESQSAAT